MREEVRVDKNPALKSISDNFIIDMLDARIRNNFPLGDKMKLALNCFKPKKNGLELIKDNSTLFQFNEMYPEAAQQNNYALKLNVNSTGILEMDQYVLHPFVRVHVVDLNTNKYLAKSDVTQPGVANKESVNFFKLEKEAKEKKPLQSPVDFFLPMSTKMYDMRVKGVNFCEWNEEFIINEKIQNLMKPNIILLFEILEFNTQLVVQDSGLLN